LLTLIIQQSVDDSLWLQRLQEKNVIFITGTDEHGEKIAASAEASGRNPKEHCDAISSSYKTLWADVRLQHQVSVYNTFHYIVNHELSFSLQIYFTFLAVRHRIQQVYSHNRS